MQETKFYGISNIELENFKVGVIKYGLCGIVSRDQTAQYVRLVRRQMMGVVVVGVRFKKSFILFSLNTKHLLYKSFI